MKGSYESKETLDFDKENSVIIKNSEFSQINIDLRNSSEDSKSAAPEIVKNDQTNPASQINPINPDENSHGENKQDPEIQVSKYETLDESYSDTFKRDFFRILNKLEHVLIPRFTPKKEKELNNWDLWGPLIFCLILCVTIAFSANNNKGGVFVIIFVIVWIGGFIITMNSRFLGSNCSFFQSVCLLGYCLFPLDIAAILIRTIPLLSFVKLIIVAVACLWSCLCMMFIIFILASVGFMSGLVEKERKMLATFPVFLFYLFISWFVLTLT